jgi:hypothetical protein
LTYVGTDLPRHASGFAMTGDCTVSAENGVVLTDLRGPKLTGVRSGYIKVIVTILSTITVLEV